MYKLFKISINYFVYNNRNYIPFFASGIVAMGAITITTRAQTLRCRTYKQDVFQEERSRGSGRPSLVTTWRQKTKDRTELIGTCRNPKRGGGHSVETPKRDQICAGRRGVVMWDLLNWRFLFYVQSTVPGSQLSIQVVLRGDQDGGRADVMQELEKEREPRDADVRGT